MLIKEKTILQLGLYSNATYVFLLFVVRPNGINLEKLIISSLLLFSVLVALFLSYRNYKFLKDIPKTTRIVFYLLMIWSMIVILRGISFRIQDWVTNFGNVYMALAWFVPIFLIIGNKIENWKIVFKAIFYMFQLMLMAFLLFPIEGKSPTEWTWLLRPLNFVILLGFYRYKLIHKALIFLALLTYIYIAIAIKQRIEFIFLTFVIIFLAIDRLKTVKIKRVFLKYILFGFLILLILVFTYGYENINLIANKIIEFQDSRTFLFKELFADFNLKEKFIGRGSLGTYYSPFMEHTRDYITNYLNKNWWGDTPDRITIEVGYLQMILKGGFILFILTTYLMLNASYLAIFKSSSKFIKRLGYFILILSIISLISFRPAFAPTFIILWTAIGTVLSKRNRQMTDDEIEKLIKFK